MVNIGNGLSFGATTKYVQILKEAKEVANRYGVRYVSTEFIIAAMLKGCGKISETLESFGVTPSSYYPRVKDVIEPSYEREGYTPRTKTAIDWSAQIANLARCDFIAPEHLFLAILETTDSYGSIIVDSIVSNYNLLLAEAKNLVNDLKKRQPEPLTDDKPLNYGQISGETLNVRQSSVCRKDNETKSSYEGLGELDSFGVNLTEMARLNKLDPVIGRDHEIKRVIETLSRRIKSNPLLIGEPGVGKTAVIEGLAIKIAKDDVPVTLKNKVVFSLDLNGIVAGAKFRGEFEERFKSAINYAKENGVILFIDEIHTILSGLSSYSVADILKPNLARGELQVIGATTIGEYNKYIEKDPALERRFLIVKVEPPKIDDCIEILKGLRDKFEAHHGIEITDSAIKAAVVLSERYITNRFLPDKAIDLIDEAAAKERLLIDTPPETAIEKEWQLKDLLIDRNYLLSSGSDYRDLDEKIEALKVEISEIKRADIRKKNHDNPYIDEESVAKVVSEQTGIPVSKLTETESQKLMNFESLLHERVIGQDLAVSAVSRALRRSMTVIKDPKKPIGSFIFVGPTGVGKTELSKALSEAIFGDENSLIRIDMSEYMEKVSVAKLIGAPPGYVGYDEEGQLTGKVRMKPYSVILFDEIEKAHPDVFNVMLQILDDGRLTDSKGRTVDFKNTIIIMTSNEGASNVKPIAKIGFGDNSSELEDERNTIYDALKRRFRPEFLNRIDEIVVFRKLTMEECGKICDLQLDALKKRMASMNVSLEFTDEAKRLILQRGYDKEYGARPLKRAITSLVETPLSDMIIKGDLRSEHKVKVIDDDGQIDFLVDNL